jgi:hypothetical protein
LEGVCDGVFVTLVDDVLVGLLEGVTDAVREVVAVIVLLGLCVIVLDGVLVPDDVTVGVMVVDLEGVFDGVFVVEAVTGGVAVSVTDRVPV